MARKGVAVGKDKVRGGGVRKTRAAAKASPALTSALSAAVDDDSAADGDEDLMDVDVEDTKPPTPAEDPEVDGEPPAWARERTPLGDAIPWFRKFQGGMHTSNRVLYGMLLSGDGGVRSYIDDEIVITRMGGSSEKDATGKLVQVADQKPDSAAAVAAANSMNNNIAVGVVIGAKNTVLKRKLPHPFNVMDYFSVTYIWYERVNGRIAVRLRLDKLDLEKKSWWAVKGSPPPPSNDQRVWVHPDQHTCTSCGVKAPRIYTVGWICVNHSCTRFWTLPDGKEPPENMDYDAKFLAYRYRFAKNTEPKPHFSLVPNFLAELKDDDPHSVFSRKCWKNGVVCPKCRQCISRRYWDGWRCDKTCGFERRLPMHTISLLAVIDDYELAPIRRAIVPEQGPGLLQPVFDDQGFLPYRRLTYTLPGAGTVTQFVSNRLINSNPNGPDDIFVQLQKTDLGLQRYPMSQAVVHGTLNAQFAVNYGMPYGFVVDVDSKPFSDACDPIMRVLGRLTWATDEAAKAEGSTALAPNELLALGYFEDMGINYHDDGEDTLGPTIASLSLGAKATKHLRMKFKYYHGFSKSGTKKTLTKNDPVLVGCLNREWRLDLKNKKANGELNDEQYEEAWWNKWKESPQTDKPVKAGAREAPPCIRTELHHGDIVVMHGAGVQKYYEHEVSLETGGGAKLRFAITARHVLPDKIEKNQWWKGKFKLTKGQIYDGK
ncbi:hypothetical protein BJX64DRAFT_270105 [Aspergillus heterothallicus]